MQHVVHVTVLYDIVLRCNNICEYWPCALYLHIMCGISYSTLPYPTLPYPTRVLCVYMIGYVPPFNVLYVLCVVVCAYGIITFVMRWTNICL